MVSPIPERIIWCYGQHHEELKNLPAHVEVYEGVSVLQNEDIKSALVIIDDLMQECGDGTDVVNLFTKGSHHRDLSIIMIVQNMFHQGKAMRSISLNTHYMVLFKNPRDAGQVRHLATQLFPGKAHYLVDAYKQATSTPHGYLLLDFRQSTPDNLRVLSGILPGEDTYYYIPK